MCRGSCYTKKAGNIGLVLRRAVAQGLRVMGDDDMDVCCSGADAPPKVFVYIPIEEYSTDPLCTVVLDSGCLSYRTEHFLILIALLLNMSNLWPAQTRALRIRAPHAAAARATGKNGPGTVIPGHAVT